MSRRQMFIGIAGLLLALIGMAAMWLPVYLDQYDIYGIKVGCGSGFSSNLAQAMHNDGRELGTQCGTALLVRRAWAIPAACIGWLLISGFLFMWVQSGREHGARQSEEAPA